jgi:hypothetical protein
MTSKGSIGIDGSRYVVIFIMHASKNGVKLTWKNGTTAIPQTTFPQTTFPQMTFPRKVPKRPFPEWLFPEQNFRPNLT